MARRFIVKDEDIVNRNSDVYEIYGDEVKHIQVLRFNVGEKIHINNGIYEIEKMTRESVVVKYLEDAQEVGVPTINTTLYMAFLKQDKMDYVVQKAVEVGIKRIVPFFSSNVIVKLDEKDRIKRKEKFQKIADEACKQCGRTDDVKIEEFLSFNELLDSVSSLDKALFAYEASNDSLRNELKEAKEREFQNIGLIIGAEGGFTPKEAEELKKIENVGCVSLGTRILRAETAAINLLSIVMYEMEE